MFTFKKIFSLTVIIATLSACNQSTSLPDQTPQAPLFDNLGEYGVKITTDSELAQKFFNQGYKLCMGFNHDEAARAFREAFRLDPTCAMCYWGLAYALGPNINAPMEDSNISEAVEAAQKAHELSTNATDWEQVLIEAMTTRYIDSTDFDRTFLDEAYSDAMRVAYNSFPENNDIAGLFAESIMDLHPWDYWKPDGTPQPWNPELLEVLEGLLKRNSAHPFGCHLYIHAAEAEIPEKALPYADTLRNLIPGASHLVHMPSHIYIRTGDYHKGTIANQLASLSDSIYVNNCKIQGYYPHTYYPHNIHFLAATASMEGRSKLAIDAAFNTAEHANHELIEDPDFGIVQHFSVIPFYVLVKFNQWDQILEMRSPYEGLNYPMAVWHYARGMAFCGIDSLSKAWTELAAIQEVEKDTSLKNIKIWGLNNLHILVQIASNVLQAEIAWKSADLTTAEMFLQRAIELEDQLDYQEPPDWFFSIRHSLGSLYLEQEKYPEAESVYKEDLEILPKNGWALNGLHESLIGQNRNDEAAKTKAELDKAWAYADINLSGSRVE